MNEIKTIIVVFKTHLDIGFTGFSRDIVKQYNDKYIPQAMHIGREIEKAGLEEGFTWTVGSWLVQQYLKTADDESRRLMCSAIEHGHISWHGLPFTMHAEYADKGLYRYGLDISKSLDERFGIKTIAAKNTDVPGSTRAIVPHLSDYGIRFLHVGVNPVSSPPDVPDFFNWVCPGGEEVTVMYNKGDYGEFAIIPGSNTAICFAHTGDNHGPQSVDEITGIYDALHEKYPSASIRAGSLNDVAEAVLKVKKSLPKVTAEIGDTWIHGVGTDPEKTSQFRALLRTAKGWEKEPRERLYEHLIMVPEHTWGMDEKVFLHDYKNYKRSLFEQARNDANYKAFEASWAEQREYIGQAVNSLPEPEKSFAQNEIRQYKIAMPDTAAYERLESSTAEIDGWKICIDDNGAICSLIKKGKELVAPGYPLGQFLYEVFSEDEVASYKSRYMTHDYDWGHKDLGKEGLGSDISPYAAHSAKCDGVYTNGKEVIVKLSSDERCYKNFGMPQSMILKIVPEAGKLHLDFAWFDKPANRIPEALWFSICLKKPLTAIRKLGEMIDPLDVVSNGNREMHCTDGLLMFDDVKVFTYDTGLIAVEKPSVYGFHNKLPDTANGVWVNLFNNQWGTNFPMWNEGGARFRFTVVFE